MMTLSKSETAEKIAAVTKERDGLQRMIKDVQPGIDIDIPAVAKKAHALDNKIEMLTALSNPISIPK